MGIGVTNVTQLAQASRISGYDKELQIQSALDDFYGKSVGMYMGGDRPTIPDAIRMKVVNKADKDSNNITITMVDKLSGEGVTDGVLMIGTEARPTTRAFVIYRNIIRKAVTSPGYGPDKLDAEPYKLYTKWIDQLSTWNKEHYGRSIRQGILEQFGETLVWGRTAPFCPRNWHPNIAVAGLSLRNMEVNYDPNVNTYGTNIVNQILASSGTNSLAPVANQTLNQPNLSNLCNWALQKRINKLTLPLKGRSTGWILTISELQHTFLGDPNFSQRNMGSLYTAITELQKEKMEWPGVIGCYKEFLIVCDVMQPTLILDGTSDWTLSAGYMNMGDIDARERDELNTRDTAFILGRGAIIDWQAEALRHVRQNDDYEIIKGHGTAKTEGITLPVWDRDTARPTNFSSAVVVLGLPDYV